jgi:hypothetical protein
MGLWYPERMLRRHRCATLAAAFLVTACAKQKTDADDGTVVTPYLAIGDTLADDRTDGVAELAAVAIAAAKTEQDKPGIDLFLDGAGRIGAEDDLERARAAYERMSNGMIAYLEADPAQQAGRMIVHCTMTFSGQGGRWVQAEGKVMNPYEGSRMLHCGDKIAWSADAPGSGD